MFLLWQHGFQNTKLQSAFVTVNQAKSSFCGESLSGERKGGPGTLNRTLDTCPCSSLRDHKGTAHAGCQLSTHQRLDSPSGPPTEPGPAQGPPNCPIRRVTLASKWERGAKEAVLCPALDKGRGPNALAVGRQRGQKPGRGPFFGRYPPMASPQRCHHP